ncbi:MAG: cytochrome c3 family protein [Planctomycetes bacterium]|nr:cytochrome c3 family protein [Planctomycetota bacterium]
MSKLKPFCVILTLLVGACGVTRLLGNSKPPPRLFNHKKHVTDEGLECASCHNKATKEDGAGMPVSLKKCMLCHEGIDEQKGEGRHLADLLGEKPVWDLQLSQPEDIKFSHKRHVTDAGVACAECHKDIETNTAISPDMKLTMDDCMSCHTQKKASTECLTCHTEMRDDVPPPSHRLNWIRNHGPVIRTADDSNYENRCDLCHRQDHCTKCHQDEPPANHTNFWRLKGHSVSASVDRSRCATCHQDDSCDRCHQDTAPRSHTASWGSPKDRHCLSCHDNAGTDCAFCHKEGTPSHLDAEDKPSWHTAGMNCRQCHGVTQPLPHPDNGDDCNACHK